eukprot:TRINITY_DN9359_c6_g1_i1.p1 TRINITY_DN9359_c6_g1~~TRINITY_DN9359_c6_g1_i1.p1  ORF type:complete len:433 (+),score=81.07 TRINITY_DN9359_c6_g1_i1:137-1435(+)
MKVLSGAAIDDLKSHFVNAENAFAASLPPEANTLLKHAEEAWIKLQRTLPPAEEKGEMFKEEDWLHWLVFFVVFVGLLAFDNIVLFGKHSGPMSMQRAILYCGFWLACAACFCGFIFFTRGTEDAMAWGTGYILEWMLSVDNLFVFRSIFVVFHTPDAQKHKPLFWGIIGAIFFRIIFFVVEEALVHYFHWMHFILGAFLIYTGFKIVSIEEDDDESPCENPLFLAISKKLHVVDSYAPTAKFFAKISVDAKTGEPVLPDWTPPVLPADYDASKCAGDPTKGRDLDFQYYATRLLLVVVCLELTDVIFAVDSVSAIVAQIPDLYLAYTACVFAMLGLRASFFVVDEVVKLFCLLQYGVAAILVFVGAKLMLKTYIHIPEEVVCSILLLTLLTSMAASVVYSHFHPPEEDSEAEKDRVDFTMEASSAEALKSA